jgi:hypothetical protein
MLDSERFGITPGSQVQREACDGRKRHHGAIALIFLISGILIQPSRGAPETDARTDVPYTAMVGKLCPDSHLELLSPADLEYTFEFFLEKLPPKTRSRFEKADDARCRFVRAGLSCRNTAFLITASKLGLTSRFIAFACKAGYVCKAQSDCGDGNLDRPNPAH